jgi:hypothetical protein
MTHGKIDALDQFGYTRSFYTKFPGCPRRRGIILPVLLPLLLLPLLLGCPYQPPVYNVYYDGNNQSEGSAPIDSRVYFTGNQAVVMDKPAGLKKGELKFLGWQQSGRDTPLQGGDTLTIEYWDIWLYAWWEPDPDNNPYTYILDSGGAVVTEYTPYYHDNSPAVIPNTLGGYPVTAIGEGVFSNDYLYGVTLPDTLQTIGNKAFSGNWLGSLVIPNSVTHIGKLAFRDGGLGTLTLGEGAALEFIDDYAFDDNNLKNLFLPAKVVYLGDGAFSANALETIKIGKNVEIKSDTSLGTHGAAFRSYYTDNGRQEGVYLYQDSDWQGPYHLTQSPD